MKEHKTLKDMQISPDYDSGIEWVALEELKQEAIKWKKHFKHLIKGANPDDAIFYSGNINFIRIFFDLK